MSEHRRNTIVCSMSHSILPFRLRHRPERGVIKIFRPHGARRIREIPIFPVFKSDETSWDEPD